MLSGFPVCINVYRKIQKKREKRMKKALIIIIAAAIIFTAAIPASHKNLKMVRNTGTSIIYVDENGEWHRQPIKFIGGKRK